MVAGLTKGGGGPTLLLIKDTKGHIFGGFASHHWEIKPQFQGERGGSSSSEDTHSYLNCSGTVVVTTSTFVQIVH